MFWIKIEVMHMVGVQWLYGIDNDINGGFRADKHGGADSRARGLHHHGIIWVLLEVNLAEPGLWLKVHLAAEKSCSISKSEI